MGGYKNFSRVYDVLEYGTLSEDMDMNGLIIKDKLLSTIDRLKYNNQFNSNVTIAMLESVVEYISFLEEHIKYNIPEPEIDQLEIYEMWQSR
jgi:hypothetical protein